MEFTTLIRERESIRNYDPARTVEEDILNRILDAGRVAPSASNRQPWTFVLVSSSEKLKEVRKCYHKDWFKDAPHILVLVGHPSQAWERSYDGYNSMETDATIAMDHMILAAENEGVGTCWIVAYDKDTLTSALGLGEDESVFCITPLGYPRKGFQKKRNKIRKELSAVVRRI